jgi:hypothetical protein
MWPCRVPLFEGGRRQVPRAGNKVPESGDLGLTRGEMILALSLLSGDKTKITIVPI